MGGLVGSPTVATDTTVGGDAVERTGVAAGTSVRHRRTTTATIAATGEGANYGKRNITIGFSATGNDADVDAVAVTSARVELAAVAHGATGVTVTRDGNKDAAGDTITASWSGPGSPGLDHRIALRVKVGTENDWEWVVVPTSLETITRATAIPGDTGPTKWGKWALGKIALEADVTASDWVDDDTGSDYTDLESDDLRAASHLRVDTRVTGAGAWNKGTPAAIPPSG